MYKAVGFQALRKDRTGSFTFKETPLIYSVCLVIMVAYNTIKLLVRG